MKTASDKLIGYLMTHPSGVSGTQLRAWLDSCRRDGGYTYAEQDSSLVALREQGRIICTNGVWWLKDIPTAQKGLEDDRARIAKVRRENRKKLRAG